MDTNAWPHASMSEKQKLYKPANTAGGAGSKEKCTMQLRAT
jgi:hypothetical protein